MSLLRTLFDRYYLGLVLALVIMIGFKTTLLITDSITFDSDEAIIGLMAKHILGGDLPLFFYGQAYMGSLDALLVAGAFALLGQQVVVIRVVQVVLGAGVIITTYTLAYRLTQHDSNDLPTGTVALAGTIAAMLLAIPPVLYNLYTTATLGNYVETLLLNNIIWLIGLDILTGQKSARGWWFALGLLAGIGWWSMALIVISIAPLMLVGVWNFRRRLPIRRIFFLIAGFLVGAFPWIIGTFQLGTEETIGDVLGAFVSGGQSEASSELAARAINALIFNLPATFGLRPPWGLTWFVLPVGILICIIYLIVNWRAFRRIWHKEETTYVRYALACYIGGMVLLIGLFIGSPFGRDITGRYLLPLVPIFAILLGNFTGRAVSGLEVGTGFQRYVLPPLGVAILLSYNLIGNVHSIQENPPGLTTQFDPISHIPHDHDADLIAFLDSIDVNRGYSNYWLAYRFAFITDEDLILLPRIPYKSDLSYTPDDNRYKPYNDLLAEADRVVYITGNHPTLDAAMRKRFQDLGITFKEQTIGPYTVFYDLPFHITPEELRAFGVTTDPSL